LTPKLRAAWTGRLREPDLGRVWLICAGYAVVGYFAHTFGYSLELQGRNAFGDELVLVAPPEVGGKTVDFVELLARALRVHALHLEPTGHNVGAPQSTRNSDSRAAGIR
jgi:hypothetical protein